MTHPPTIDEQLRAAAAEFRRRFDRPPRFAAVAPGRVNLIGEHTDYNNGFVLPMAIERQTVVVADRAPAPDDRRARVVSAQGDSLAEFMVAPSLAPGEPAWSNYVRGVVAGCLAAGLDPGGFDAVIHSTVPLGGGLSSSAALEVSVATLIEAMTGRPLGPAVKARLCQRAEHDYAGLPCGIMDQTISASAQAGHAMLLDCRSLETRMVPLADPSVTVLIANSNVKHALTGGEYAQRRAQCEAAARAIGAASLRDVSAPQLAAASHKLEATILKRARHVVGEIERTRLAADAAVAADWRAFGRLMVESHQSLRDDFEVSCAELDLLVTLAGEDHAVYGSRMTGGGFGGCTVSLVRSEAVDRVSRHLAEGYRRQTGIEATLFATHAAAGASPHPV